MIVPFLGLFKMSEVLLEIVSTFYQGTDLKTKKCIEVARGLALEERSVKCFGMHASLYKHGGGLTNSNNLNEIEFVALGA